MITNVIMYIFKKTHCLQKYLTYCAMTGLDENLKVIVKFCVFVIQVGLL